MCYLQYNYLESLYEHHCQQLEDTPYQDEQIHSPASEFSHLSNFSRNFLHTKWPKHQQTEDCFFSYNPRGSSSV